MMQHISRGYGRRVHRKARTSIILIFAAALPAVVLLSAAPSRAAELGRIVSISTDRQVVSRGEPLQFRATVESWQPGQGHHLVVFNLIGADNQAIIDSHKLGRDIDFVIRIREQKTVVFSASIPAGARPGTYNVVVGYRVFPWEPLIAFRGAQWAPPVYTVTVR